MTAPFAHLTPPREPTLLQATVRAIQASEALTATIHADDETWTRLEADQFASREALYEALERHGIDRALANRMGAVL